MILKRICPNLAVTALLLAACAGAPHSDQMTWGYAEASDPEGPKLAFGVDGSDYLAVMLMCDPTTGTVVFDIPLADGRDASAVKLRSSGVVRRYEPFFPDEVDGYAVSHFKTGHADPVLNAFVKSGRLAIDVYGGFVPHDVKTGSERAAIRTFATACGLR